MFRTSIAAAACLVAVTSCGSAAAPSSQPTVDSASAGTGVSSATGPNETDGSSTSDVAGAPVRVGADVAAADGFSDLQNERVGFIVNSASLVGEDHVVDLAVQSGVQVEALFAPEHGVRGSAAAGELVRDEVDEATGLTVFSLYGDTKKPSVDMLENVDTLVFDLQDVGTRYYTYISTLGLAMQAASENGVKFVVLDRPNPQGGQTISGFTPSADVESFVSRYPIPSVYGLTAGELASAIVGEKWLDGLDELDLTIVKMQGWNRQQTWADTKLAWTPPSPGLPSAESALIYPSTVYFEASNLSYGQGTGEPFQLVGAPWIEGEKQAEKLNGFGLPGVRFEALTFTPRSTALHPQPPFEDTPLSGVRVVVTEPADLDATAVGVHLVLTLQTHAAEKGQGPILANPDLVDLLFGSSTLRQGLNDVTVGAEAEAADRIRAEWAPSVSEFAELRTPYLLY